MYWNGKYQTYKLARVHKNHTVNSVSVLQQIQNFCSKETVSLLYLNFVERSLNQCRKISCKHSHLIDRPDNYPIFSLLNATKYHSAYTMSEIHRTVLRSKRSWKVPLIWHWWCAILQSYLVSSCLTSLTGPFIAILKKKNWLLIK